MKTKIINGILVLLMFYFNAFAHAEDTDLFMSSAVTSNDVPNVLFIVDNTANWSTAFENEKAALVSVFESIDDSRFRIGIMFSNETGNPNNNTKGGYVRAALRLMDSANKGKYSDLIQSLNVTTDKGNGGVSSLVMAEAYRYFKAAAPYAGNGKAKTDYTGNISGTTADKAVYALSGNALSSKDSTVYTPPASSGCAKNYIIYLSNGPSQDNNSVITQSNSMLSSAGGSTTQIPVFPNGSQANPSDEWARFMKQSSLGVLTYTIDVLPSSTGQGPGWTALLKSMASDPTRYIAVTTNSADKISLSIKSALSQIQAVNSVFASVSLPVSVNTQGTYLNQVFVGMFRPDEGSHPRWNGNLKQYKLGGNADALQLQDADNDPAISSSGTGFIDVCARSFWTPTDADSYWSFFPQGECIAPDNQPDDYYSVSNSPDGDIVEKGAQAYKLRAATSRTIKTCSTTFITCSNTETPTSFDTSNADITAALLGTTSELRSTLINWARGDDLLDEDIDGSTTEKRPSSHGDVVHSRPVALNYGTKETPEVVVYYGANDGMLRAVNGNRSSSIDSFAAGSEIWSFVAPESYALFKRLYDNTDLVKTPNVEGTPKAYGFDGPVTAYKNGDTAYLYATMRRGGRVLYSFDVSKVNGDIPAQPKLKWKKGCPNNFPVSGVVSDTDCSNGFSEIAQTWSAPKLLKAKGYENKNLLIMGGGYDPCEDSDPHSCSAPGYSLKGNRIYVMDADTGELLKTFTTERSVVGDIAVLPDTSTGLATYAYAADMGGNVYRINIGENTPQNWTSTQIASLGCKSLISCSANRKFMFAPDLVNTNGFVYLMLGSGDREKPVLDYASAYDVTNYFFVLKDKPSDEEWLSTEPSSLISIDSLSEISEADSKVTKEKGWYLTLASHEQVVTSAITVFGNITFSTHTPASAPSPDEESCTSTLGTARVYSVEYTSAKSANGTDERFEEVAGGGLPPSPVAGMVTLDSGETVPFIIGGSSTSPLEGGAPDMGTSAVQPKARIFWYIDQ